MQEKWLPVPGYENYYEISNMGQFIILQTRKRRNGRAQEAGVFEGEKTCLLYNNDDEECHRVFLSNLVLETFVGPRPPGKDCCHIDDNRNNNRLDNLYWGDHSTNKKDAVRNGIANIPKGERNGSARLTEASVLEARTLYSMGWTTKQLARRNGVTESTMYKAINRETWKHLT